LLKFFHLTGKS